MSGLGDEVEVGKGSSAREVSAVQEPELLRSKCWALLLIVTEP